MTRRKLELDVPRKLAPLLRPARYKGAHGGRGGSKSHFFAQLAVERNATKPMRGVCIREVQNSIKESVKQLIEDKIGTLGVAPEFDIVRDEIRGRNGSLITFRGMQSFNADNIKSLEGYDWAWVEEAQSLSKRSWDLLRPTIRKPGSEIWASWNPRHDTDAVDQFFRGPNPHPEAICIEVNWPDNPWFPAVLRTEMERDFAADPEMAEHVWGGGYEIVSEGAYYARWVAAAEREGRVGHFPYDPRQRLRTSWDLGVRDYTSIWFIQDDGEWATVVDFYEANGIGFDEIVSRCFPELFRPPMGSADFVGWDQGKALSDWGRDQPFVYNAHFLPHDVRVRELGSGARHRFEVLQDLGLRNILKGVAGSPEERVTAGRSLFPRLRFNDTPRVRHGLKRLRRYKRKFNDLLGTYEGPLQDGNQHAADAFGEYAVNCDLLPREAKPTVPPLPKRLEVVEIGPGFVRSNIDPSDEQPKLNPKEFIEMIKKSRAK